MTARALLRRGLAGVLFLACLAFLLHGLDWNRLAGLLRAHALWSYALAGLLFAAATLPMGLRFHWLLGGRCTLGTATRAVFLGAGVNNLLPARLGDIAKAVWLSRESGIGFPTSLCAVFWERLADLCTVLALAVLLGIRYDAGLFYGSLLLAVSGAGVGVILICRRPAWFLRLAELLPAGALRRQLQEVITLLADTSQHPRHLRLFALSLLVWGTFSAFNAWFLHAFFGLPLTFWTGLLVGVAGAVGMMIPGLPAHAGTFEASVVAALLLAGQDKSTATAAALLLHAVQVLPCTLYAGWLMLCGFRLKDDLTGNRGNHAQSEGERL